MKTLKPIEGLTDAFVRVLRTDIVKGILPIGSPLSSENDLATKYGVSRAVIREGTRELANLGMITKRQGQKSTISPRSKWNLMDPQVLATLLEHDENGSELLNDLFAARLLIESYAAAEASLNRDDHDLQMMTRELDIMQSAIESPNDFIKADLEFHRLVHQSSKNIIIISLLSTISDLLRVSRQYTIKEPQELRSLISDHQAIYLAILQQNPTSAKKAMSQHLLKIYPVLKHSSSGI